MVEKKCVIERDINDIFDDIVLTEERISEQSYGEGFEAGKLTGNTDGYHLGYHRGAELGAELGFYNGTLTKAKDELKCSERASKAIETCLELIDAFPRTNDENCDILGEADRIRAQYKKTCALLKINGKFPDSDQLTF